MDWIFYNKPYIRQSRPPTSSFHPTSLSWNPPRSNTGSLSALVFTLCHCQRQDEWMRQAMRFSRYNSLRVHFSLLVCKWQQGYLLRKKAVARPPTTSRHRRLSFFPLKNVVFNFTSESRNCSSHSRSYLRNKCLL